MSNTLTHNGKTYRWNKVAPSMRILKADYNSHDTFGECVEMFPYATPEELIKKGYLELVEEKPEMKKVTENEYLDISRSHLYKTATEMLGDKPEEKEETVTISKSTWEEAMKMLSGITKPVQLIRGDIERRKEGAEQHDISDFYYLGVKQLSEDLLTFIDSLIKKDQEEWDYVNEAMKDSYDSLTGEKEEQSEDDWFDHAKPPKEQDYPNPKYEEPTPSTPEQCEKEYFDTIWTGDNIEKVDTVPVLSDFEWGGVTDYSKFTVQEMGAYIDELGHHMEDLTKVCQYLLKKPVLPIARIPDHIIHGISDDQIEYIITVLNQVIDKLNK